MNINPVDQIKAGHIVIDLISVMNVGAPVEVRKLIGSLSAF